MTSVAKYSIVFYMKRKTRYEVGFHLRMSAEDSRHLEAIAERERSTVSAVARRFIAEALDREAEGTAKRPKERRKKP